MCTFCEYYMHVHVDVYASFHVCVCVFFFSSNIYFYGHSNSFLYFLKISSPGVILLLSLSCFPHLSSLNIVQISQTLFVR